MKTEKFYPFSAALCKALEKHGVLEKAKEAYDKLPMNEKVKELEKECDALDACFIFSDTEEGTGYWYDVHLKITK